MTEKIFDGKGNIRKTVYDLCDVLLCSPESLFTESQMHAELETNKRSILVNEAECMFYLQNENEPKLLDNIIIDNENQETIKNAIGKLTPREQEVINKRFGIDGNIETLEEIAKSFDVSRERIRQIEAKALRKLRNPYRHKELLEIYNENNNS